MMGKKQISPTRQEDEPDSKQVLQHEALSTFDVVLLQYWKLFDCV